MNKYYPNDVLKIPNATESKTDAAQYMFRKGKKQYNLCGEFCVAYCMKDEAHTSTIDDFLDYWEAKDKRWYPNLFPNQIARKTGLSDLINMLLIYEDQQKSQQLFTVKSDPYIYNELLLEHQLIIGVQIDNYGYLVGKGIPHWIVVEHMQLIDLQHAIMDIYNPFTNSIEPYTWRELMNSSGEYKQGLWIER